MSSTKTRLWFIKARTRAPCSLVKFSQNLQCQAFRLGWKLGRTQVIQIRINHFTDLIKKREKMEFCDQNLENNGFLKQVLSLLGSLMQPTLCELVCSLMHLLSNQKIIYR